MQVHSRCHHHQSCIQPQNATYLHRLASEDDEVFSAHHHEPHELMAEDLLDLVGLLDGDADANRVDGRLDEHSLLLVTRNGDRREQKFLARPTQAGRQK